MMAVTDIPTLESRRHAGHRIGHGRRGLRLGTGLAFSSNGDGTLTIVKQVNGKYEAVDTVTTERGARTMTVDQKLNRVYLLAAEYGPAPEAKDGKKGRAAGPARQLPRAGHRKIACLVAQALLPAASRLISTHWRNPHQRALSLQSSRH